MRSKLPLTLVLTLLLAATLAGCSGAPSENPSPLASLSESVGDVSVSDDGGGWAEAHTGMSLDTGDGIKTGNDSTAEITFLDGSTIELQANTEIDIVALEISTDTGSKTITLNQIIGDTISRVTHLIDPASSYEINTPSGTAGVRGSTMLVHVGADGTTVVTNQEGVVYAIAQGAEVDIPVGQSCIISPGQPPDLTTVAFDDSATTPAHTRITIPVLNNDFDPYSGDSLIVSAVTQGTYGQVFNNVDSVTYAPFFGFSSLDDTFTYNISDGRGGTATATVTVTVTPIEEFAYVEVSVEVGPSGNIYIWDETSNWWAIDEDTGYEINGIHHETYMVITVAAGRRYYVWLETTGSFYDVASPLPDGWEIRTSPPPNSGYNAAYGYVASRDSYYSVVFNIIE
jgi:hypothetical protein